MLSCINGMMNKPASVAASLVVVLLCGAFALGECPEMAKMKELYHQKRYISLEFLQIIRSDVFETVDTVAGTLWAGWEGRFRLTTPDQVLVSNGALYWSYSVENQQVLVDSVDELGSWNPLTLLYDPEQVYACRDQNKKGGAIEFAMAAIDTLTAPAKFTLTVTPGTFEPRSLVYFDDNDSRIDIRITKFARLNVLPDSLFEFHPGPGVEVIEMP
jgi:outer membrane lipoprotein-sorting protein